MAYQALYRRFRPTKFSEFVGQEAVIRTLRSQVANGRIAHAYLFCGTRGTGKTSAAKVFARAINCETPEDGEPCGACPTCKALQEDSSLDILEIDAASNNGVDEIRDLREKVKYPPAVGRYRVYIIDEVHMLSSGAFNALLKTLEEPPAHVKFILATTEPQKLLATILSRCQRFDFGRIPLYQIAERLEAALKEENVPFERGAVERIARAAEGGMRDAWSITDMCLGYAQENADGLTDALVRDVLGSLDRGTLFEFTDLILNGDSAGVLQKIEDVMRSGKEVQVFVKDISGHFRSLLTAKVCGKEACMQILEITQEDAEELNAQALKADENRLMRIMNLFLQAENEMKWSSQPRFALEAAALRACKPEEALQLEALQERVNELERKLQEGVVMAAPVRGARQVKSATDKADDQSEKADSLPKVPEGAEAIYKAAMQEIRKTMPMLYGLLQPGRLAFEENGCYTVVFNAKTGAINMNMLNTEERSAQVAAALSMAAGQSCTFRAALEGTVPEKDKRILDEQEEKKKQAEENLNKIFSVFGRENVRIVDN